MLVIHPVGPRAAHYYFQGQGEGRWVGRGLDAFALSGVVGRKELVALLRGCDPGDGRFLPTWKPHRRRSGWDLTLAAPKSLSLFRALAEGAGDAVAAAHRAAVDDTIVDFERRLLRLRRSATPGGLVPSEGAVAAAFDHLVNAAGEPHVHTHVLLMNMGRSAGGTWSAIASEWWPARHSIAAIYQLGLRYHLAEAGLHLDWRTREDGLADLADVPRAAVRATSSRGRTVAAARAAYPNPGGGRRFGVRGGATARTRQTTSVQPWEARALTSGFGRPEAARVVAAGRAGPTQIGEEQGQAGSHDRPADAALTRAVTARLASRRSTFRQSDVLVAVAACRPEGMESSTAADWAERFCAGAVAVAGGRPTAPRWTTQVALEADQRLVGRVLHSRELGRRPDGASLVESAIGRYPALSDTGRDALRQLMTRSAPFAILCAPPGRGNILAQAAVLEALGWAWQAAGLRVAVFSGSPDGPPRWQALTGIEPQHPRRRPDVIVVDHVDRRTTPELLSILSGVEQAGAELILVEGGTSPRLSSMRSDGLATLADRLGRVDPGPTPLWAPDPRSAGEQAESEVRRAGPHPSAAGAASSLVARWADESSTAHPAVLVGLGYPEADALNQAARSVRVRRGEISGPALLCGGRELQAGDWVLPLRRVTTEVPAGKPLTVAEVDTAASRVTVSGSQRTTRLERNEAAHLGYAYAVTPALLARTTGRLMVLGLPESVGPYRDRVATWATATPGWDLGSTRSWAAAPLLTPARRQPALEREAG